MQAYQRHSSFCEPDFKIKTNLHSLAKKGPIQLPRPHSQAQLSMNAGTEVEQSYHKGHLSMPNSHCKPKGGQIACIVDNRGKRTSLSSLSGSDVPDIEQLIRDLKLTPSSQSSFADEKIVNEHSVEESGDRDHEYIFRENMKAIEVISQHLRSLKQNQLVIDEAQTINMLLQSISKKISHAKTFSNFPIIRNNKNHSFNATNASSINPMHTPSMLKISSTPVATSALSACKPTVSNFGIQNIPPAERSSGKAQNLHRKQAVCEVSPIKQLVADQTSSRILYTNFSLKQIQHEQSSELVNRQTPCHHHPKESTNFPTNEFIPLQTPASKSTLSCYSTGNQNIQRSFKKNKTNAERQDVSEPWYDPDQLKIQQLNDQIKTLEKLLRDKTQKQQPTFNFKPAPVNSISSLNIKMNKPLPQKSVSNSRAGKRIH